MDEMISTQKINKTRKTYSTKFKKRVVRDLLSNSDKTMDIASKYNIRGNTLSSWKYAYGKEIKKDLSKKKMENLTKEEDGFIASIKRECEKKIEAKDKELESLYSEIGRLTINIKILEGK